VRRFIFKRKFNYFDLFVMGASVHLIVEGWWIVAISMIFSGSLVSRLMEEYNEAQ